MADFDEMGERKRLTYRLAAEVGVDPRTVQRWLAGHRVSGAHELAIERAVQRLGLQKEVGRFRPVAA